jgi:hypothetical protein
VSRGSPGAGEDAQRLGGYTLLLAAGTGSVLAAKAPHRWGRPGGALVIAGLSMLLTRDTIMIASGLPGRLRAVPRTLLVIEALGAAAAIGAGAGPWLLSHRPLSVAERTATALTTATFAIHTLRQAIYLSPGHGRR